MTERLLTLVRSSLSPRVKTACKKILYFGHLRYCPVCRSWLRSFKQFGDPPRPDALCPVCGSVERHRLVWLFLGHQTNLFDGSAKRMLHLAPEQGFDERFRRVRGLDYLTADLNNPSAMVQMDITNIEFPDNSFDVIYCSHVLEHVPNDRKAMRELCRVLRADGWAVIMVPITADMTFEDPSVTDPSERERIFGQFDHVRRYGADFVERLREEGFHVRPFSACEIVGDDGVVKLGVGAEQVFLCNKDPKRFDRGKTGEGINAYGAGRMSLKQSHDQ